MEDISNQPEATKLPELVKEWVHMDNEISVIINKFNDKLEEIINFKTFKQEIQLKNKNLLIMHLNQLLFE